MSADVNTSPDDPIPVEAPAAPDAGEATNQEAAIQLVARMSVAEKIAAALKGSRELRLLLVCDPNRIVAMSVLNSPKLTEVEVEQIARMSRVSEDVLRVIGQERAWMKHYPIMLALVRNAKTPLAISLRLLAHLTARDVKVVSTDRNVPDPLRIAARRRTVERQ
jgi:hypothetical protein